jgi:hypothetical protein
LIAGVVIAAGLVELALLALWQRNGYWDFSDGVYAQSARELLHGLTPYRDFAAAQPPGVYLVGALLLAVHDGLSSVRAGMAVADLASAVLVGVCVWRLTGLRWVAIVAALVAPLLPISLREHAQLIPETLAAPLLLAGALLCARPARAAWGGVLLALAVSFKLAFVVPALAIALSGRDRWRATGAFVAAGLGLAVASLAVFGTDVWREAVHAQLQVGRPSLHYAGGLLAQGAWSELALLVPAAAGVWLVWRGRIRPLDEPLMRTVIAAAVAGLLLAFTVFKRGSYINVLVVAEPPLLVLAAAGAVWSARLSRAGAVVVGVLGLFLAAQTISLLAQPSDPSIAKRPGAASGLAWTAGPRTVSRIVAAARRCPRTQAYSGDPYYAFLSGRRMPGSQPDLFMLADAPIDAGFARRAAADEGRCP